MSEEHKPSEAAPAPSTPTDAAPAAIESTNDDRMLALLAHLLGLFTWFVGALIIWLMKKDTSAYLDDQGKEALNFQITIGILWIIAGVVAGITCGIGVVLMPVVWIIDLVFCIMAALAAQKGEVYRYPLCWRLVK